MKWEDKSDSKSRFFTSECDTSIEGSEFINLINEFLLFIIESLINKSHAHYDKLFLEINCDTGRIIMSPSTEAGRARGVLDGCAVRLQKLQDFWYDLDESGVSGDQFSENIRDMVLRIGRQFESEIEKLTGIFFLKYNNSFFELIVFGSESEEVIFRREFNRIK